MGLNQRSGAVGHRALNIRPADLLGQPCYKPLYMPGHSALETLVGEMTVAELAGKSRRSVEDIVSWAMSGTAGGRPAKQARAIPTSSSSAPTAAAKGAPRARGSAINTRSAQGRAEYEANVLRVVKAATSPISAPEIRDEVGGTPQQARAALNRLIELGEINYQGRARATRYSA